MAIGINTRRVGISVGANFLGTFPSLVALQTAHPSPAEGSYAFVDTGVGTDIESYIWDNTDSAYVLGSHSPETAATIKSKYESNADTNAFTDAEKTKLAGITGTNTGDEIQATETVSGIAEIATQAETDAGTDDTKIVSPLKLANYFFNPEYAESEAESTTTSATYQQKLRLTTSSLSAGDYYIEWSAEVETTDQDMNVKCELDDTIIINEAEYSTGYTTVSGFKKVTLTAGVHTVDIDYHNAGGGTAKIRRTRIKLTQ